MTFLELVNSVLVRLREERVSTVYENEYSTLISNLVNVAKTEVENAYNWEALRKTVTLITKVGTFHYELLNTTTNIRTLDVYNYTNKNWMDSRTTEWFDRAFAVEDVVTGSPSVYAWNGVSSTGNMEVDLYPIPSTIQTLRFNMTSPQPPLKIDADPMFVPDVLVIENAVARAIEERGEDGGSSNQQQRYQNMLADFISMESSRKPMETVWRSV
tara:strand:+ start:3046 stop:3687 length:642 start_codon:yes stop_codon:yes gene_type:complete